MQPRILARSSVLALAFTMGACDRDQQTAPIPSAGGHASAAPNDAGGTTTQPTASRPSDDAKKATEFARFVAIGADEGKFETAITRYRNADGVEVALIAAIHIADAKHFEELNQEFPRYDALLYELVAPETYRPKPGDPRGGAFNPIAMLQNGLKNALQLSFQLDAIDYTPDNFVHADLTPSGFAAAMRENDESILTIMLNMMGRQARAMANRDDDPEDADGEAPGDFDIIRAFQNREGRHALRMMFGQQLMAIESIAAGGEETVLLEGRNDRALEVLEEQIAAGKRNLAIYYGAAHMPDIERKLFADGFEKLSQRWLEAWDIRKRLDPKPGATPRVGAPR